MCKNVLFVCSANKERSKTAEDYFSSLYPDILFNSCGTNIKYCKKVGTNPITEDFLAWADVIFVMESKHAKQVREYSVNKYGATIIVLAIEDKYTYYQKELIELLIAKTAVHF